MVGVVERAGLLPNDGDSPLNSACCGLGSSAGFGPRLLGVSLRLVPSSRPSMKASLPSPLNSACCELVSSPGFGPCFLGLILRLASPSAQGQLVHCHRNSSSAMKTALPRRRPSACVIPILRRCWPRARTRNCHCGCARPRRSAGRSAIRLSSNRSSARAGARWHLQSEVVSQRKLVHCHRNYKLGP